MTNDITAPLRLAVGSHKAGSGRGCAQNVISWENGDKTITDLPPCADPMLSRVVQQVNDAHCTHREDDLLCPPCSVEVLALAHRTAGTALVGWDGLAVRRVWVRLALDEAQSVARPAEDVRVTRCREATAAWLGDPSPAAAAAAAASAGAAAAYAASGATRAAYAAASAAASAGAAAAYAAAAYAAAAGAAASAAASAAYAGGATRLERAHRLIDRFEALTGVSATTPDPAVTEAALDAMRRVTA